MTAQQVMCLIPANDRLRKYVSLELWCCGCIGSRGCLRVLPLLSTRRMSSMRDVEARCLTYEDTWHFWGRLSRPCRYRTVVYPLLTIQSYRILKEVRLSS